MMFISNVVLCLIGTALLSKTDQIVQKTSSQEGFNDFQSRWLFVVTWYKVDSHGGPSVQALVTLTRKIK